MLAKSTGNLPEVEDVKRHKPSKFPLQLLMAVLGLAGLTFGADLMVTNAISLAQSFNVSEAVIAITIVAAGTSLPELATSVVAAIRKETDMAVGNIVGSNIFNLLCIGGITPLVAPRCDVSKRHTDRFRCHASYIGTTSPVHADWI